VSDESQLQVTPKDGNSSLSLSKARSSLMARGRRDAATLADSSAQQPTDPLSELCRRAEGGDPEAQCRLGEVYAGGDGVARNYVQAVYWLREAALGGIEDAREVLKWLAPDILMDDDLWRDE